MKLRSIAQVLMLPIIAPVFALSEARAGPPTLDYSAPLVIRQPGTYTGNYRSDDPNVPALEIYSDGEVIIENCNLVGAGDLIRVWSETKVTVRNCNGYGLGSSPGKFLGTANLKALNVTHNYIENVSKGVLVYQFHGKGGTDESIKIVGNVARNINGSDRPSFVQFNEVTQVSQVEIAYNQVINEPGVSAVEDNINMYNSSGTTASPIRIHDNYVQGAYPKNIHDPFTGTGMTSDGSGVIALMTGNIEATENTFLSTCNAAMNLAGGYNIRYHHNRMITSSLMPDGSGEIPVGCTWAATGGWNNFNLPSGSPYFTQDSIDNNVIGFVRKGISNPYPDRQDISPGCSDGICHDNQNLPNPVSLIQEKNEWLRWNWKLLNASQTIGSAQNSNNGSTSTGSGANVFYGPANAGGANLPVPDPVTTSQNWQVIGHEYDTLTVPDNSTVRYGANGNFIQKYVSGTFVASTAFFGSDPAPGFGKEVDLLIGNGSAPTPTPSATPVPTPSATPVPTPSATPVPTPSATPVPTPSATPVPGQVWTLIGHEYESLNVPNDSTVRFGANGNFVQKIVSGNFIASNEFFGSDPAPGFQKEVDLLIGNGSAPTPTPSATPVPTPSATPVPTPSATPVPGQVWTLIGHEYESLNVPNDSTVRFGANGNFVQKIVSGNFIASNEFFGSDPAPGFQKEVDLLVSASPATAPMTKTNSTVRTSAFWKMLGD